MAIAVRARAAATRLEVVVRLARFRRDENGATAVEFGLIALPFFAILFAIIQAGLVFFAGQVLDSAVANASRLIRTGQAQQQNFDAAKFKDQICEQVDALFSCPDLKIDVQRFKTFGDVDLSPPIDKATGNFKMDPKYQPGDGGDIVVVRTFYEWPVFTKLLGFDLTNLANGNHLLSAVTAFRNEPFPWKSAGAGP
jgi:Flp pilus assembly protein TadG